MLRFGGKKSVTCTMGVLNATRWVLLIPLGQLPVKVTLPVKPVTPAAGGSGSRPPLQLITIALITPKKTIFKIPLLKEILYY